MSTTAAPPRPRPEAPADTARRAPSLLHRSRPSNRWVFGVGLLLSAIVHLGVFVLLYHAAFVPVPVAGPRLDPDEIPPSPGLRVYNLAVDGSAPAAGAERPEEPRPEPTPEAEAPPEEAGEATRRTVAERLRPRMVDRRLWAPVDVPAWAEEEALTTEDVEGRIARRLGVWNDSATAAAERARRATDWTVEDSSGGRWGISPGRIHLGKLTLPLPLMLPPPSGPVGERVDEWSEIQDQAAREAARQSFEDRVRAIRERREREREEAKEEDPPPPQDPGRI